MPYTYLIGWSKFNIFYYGVRYSKKCNVNDLWVQYKTSSKYVHEFTKNNGDPDIIQVRKVFDNKDLALKWESKVLKRMDVVKDCRFLNRWDNNMIPLNMNKPFPFEDPKIQNKVDKKLKLKYGARGSASKVIKSKVEKTNMVKYGTNHTLHNDNVTLSRKFASLNKTGFENVFCNNEYIQKFISNKYGVKNVMHNPQIRAKHKNTMENKNWNERNAKMKITNIEKYGISCKMNIPEIREMNKLCCPYDCKRQHKFDVGNFTNHMVRMHKWSKDEVNEYKIKYKKNKNVRPKNWDVYKVA
jgi:hypothetical protein